MSNRDRRPALVPTMGALHAGHESLIRAAVATGRPVIVSIFVNPAQFGPNEDLTAYPRRTEEDVATARAAGADMLFLPDAADMYDRHHATWVIPDLGSVLCGASRTGHFRGVCTVVLKLLLLTRAHIAFFGEKDRQQLVIIRRMVQDLNVPVEIAGCSTVREADGLALSSRNAYLTPEERAQAPQLYAGLQQAYTLAQGGERRVGIICAAAREHWRKHLPVGREEYLELVDPDNLQPITDVEETALLVAAVRLGKARLIDNILLHGPFWRLSTAKEAP